MHGIFRPCGCCMPFVLLLVLYYHVQRAFASSSSSSSAPWQSESGTVQDSSEYMDLSPTIFAPNGRLYSVEAAVRAAEDDTDPSSNTAIAIVCEEGVVVVTTLNRSPYIFDTIEASSLSQYEQSKQKSLLILEEEELNRNYQNTLRTRSITVQAPFARIMTFSGGGGDALTSSNTILGVTAGNAADGQVLRRKLLRIGDSARATQSDLTCGATARQLADQQQILTQQSGKGGRLLASMALILSSQDLWRVDPTGQFWQCRAAAIGPKARVVEQMLLDQLIVRQKQQQTQPGKKKKKSTLWSSLIKKKNKNKEKGLSYRKPSELHALLAELSIEEALVICMKCLTEVFKPKVIPGVDHNEVPALRVRALALQQAPNGYPSGSSTVMSYSHSDLKMLAETGE